MTTSKKNFPKNVFPDSKPSDFTKLNKKNVTEDFVAENLVEMGWRIFRPFNDTGIDLILMKKVCSNNCTPLNEKEVSEKCISCGRDNIYILRYVQVKTRSLKKGIFGFTLTSKDLRVDPRHFFILYCDTTLDLFFISIYEYLQFFTTIGSNPFSTMSFRKGNQKLNSLRYNQIADKWTWSKKSWEKFRNENGLRLLQNIDYDINLESWITKVREKSDELIMTYKGISSIEPEINDYLKKRIIKEELVLNNRKSSYDNIKSTVNQENIESIKKYWAQFNDLRDELD